MVFHRNQAQFARARWRNALLFPVWSLQSALLLGLTGIFAYRLAETVETFDDRQANHKTPTVELVWECVNLGFAVVCLGLTVFEIVRFFAETLTPFFLLASHVVKFTAAAAILALDIVIYVDRSEGHWSIIGLVIDVVLLASILTLGIYSIITFRKLLAYDDYHHPANVKAFGFGNDNGYNEIEMGQSVNNNSSSGITANTTTTTNTTATTVYDPYSVNGYNHSVPVPYNSQSYRGTDVTARIMLPPKSPFRSPTRSPVMTPAVVPVGVPITSALDSNNNNNTPVPGTVTTITAGTATGDTSSGRNRSLSSLRRKSKGSTPGATPNGESGNPFDDTAAARRPSYNHERDTQFDAYRSNRSLARPLSKEDIDQAIGAELWGAAGVVPSSSQSSAQQAAAAQAVSGPTTLSSGPTAPTAPRAVTPAMAAAAERSNSLVGTGTVVSQTGSSGMMVVDPLHRTNSYSAEHGVLSVAPSPLSAAPERMQELEPSYAGPYAGDDIVSPIVEVPGEDDEGDDDVDQYGRRVKKNDVKTTLLEPRQGPVNADDDDDDSDEDVRPVVRA